ncbi:MAG: universal stress protein [Chlorobi bacterium]|nr:universal stress protein [Chlorobiota bacterium]
MKKILVPIDFSDYSNYVAKYAIGVAKKINGIVTLFHAYLDPTLGAPVPTYDFGSYQETYSGIIEDTEKLEIEKLQSFYNKLSSEFKNEEIENIKINYELESGFPEEEILTYCNKEQTDLIAIGTKGKGGLIRDLFGSVTEKIVENANIPVLVIPEKSDFKGINNILYATDYRESDDKAIDKLADIFSSFEVTLNCVHICYVKKEWQDMVKMVNLRNKVRSKFDKMNIDCSIVESNDIINGFEDFLSQRKIDLIAMTTHKRNVFTKYLNPSFTKKFIFKSQLPLLIFHA